MRTLRIIFVALALSASLMAQTAAASNQSQTVQSEDSAGSAGSAAAAQKSLPAAPSSAAFPLPPQSPQEQPESPAEPASTADLDTQTDITVDVKLVNLFVTVTDANGAPVGSLTKNDFELFEDGVPQKISVFDRQSELPLSIVMAIDTSLSTKKDLKLELESARRFARSILRPADRLSLFQFNEVVSEVVPFTADLRRVDRGIQNLRVGTATALYDALYLGSEALEARRGRKVIVVITDGGDTASKVRFPEAVRAAQQAEAIVYSIIIVPIESSAGRDTGGEHALIEISRETGGKYYYATSMGQLDSAFRQISEELRTQYLLAYYPLRRATDSDFRRFEVRVSEAAANLKDPASVKLRYRAGYFTSNYK
ncbi:MAG: VWA domain-containing protein [Terriglobales bacterium]